MAVLTIHWTEEDLHQVLKNEGKECSRENLEKLKDSSTLKYLEEKSIEVGWEILSSAVRQI